jgi:putative hemolysin
VPVAQIAQPDPLHSSALGDDPPISYIDPAMSATRRVVVRAIERATGQRKLKRVYTSFRAEGGTKAVFWSEMLRRSQITLDFDRAALGRIPREGPLMVVANHPYGLVDGFALCWLIHQVRPDFKLLINSVLSQAPETAEHFLPLEFSGTRAAQQTNIRSRAAARAQLEAGGCLVVFPAGAISTSPDRWGRRPAMDGPWQPIAGQLVQRGRCPVLPVYFEGQNSRLFQIVSHYSVTLRLALIAGEIRRRFGTRLGMRVGDLIPFADLAPIADRTALAGELCRRTYALGGIDTTVPGMIVDWPEAIQDKPRRER